ncbi:response regulator [Sphingomonas crocodyli]|nr:response regulator [Sphingomonas crocodyli]
MMNEAIKTLLIEDEDDIRFVVEMALGRHPEFDVTTFTNGLEALEALHGTTDVFDLALINVNLPAISGPEVASQLSDLHCCSGIPVIFVTAVIHDRDSAKLNGDNVTGVISKPFNALSLGDDIKALIDRGGSASAAAI